MSDQNISPAVPVSPRAVGKPRVVSSAEPVREYIGDLAGELAGMARDVGDNGLARALEVAADLAMRPKSGPIALAMPLKRRA